MKKLTKQKLIYARYILPTVLMLIMLVLAFLPCYRFISGGEVKQSISLFGLVKNSWDHGREALFAKSGLDNGQIRFYKTMLTLIIGFAVLYAVALAAAVWSMITALKLFISDDEKGAEKSRTLFITFIPNRVVLCVAEALMIAPALTPYLIPAVYASTLDLTVRVALVAPDCLIFSLLSVAAICILSAVCAPMERRFDADVFKKRRKSAFPSGGNENVDYTPVFGSDGVKNESEEEKKIREEKAEIVRRILGNKEDKNEDEK